MIKGDKVIQGYLDSKKNPEDTWITGSYSIPFGLQIGCFNYPEVI